MQGDTVAQAWGHAPRNPCYTIPSAASKSGSYSAHVPKLISKRVSQIDELGFSKVRYQLLPDRTACAKRHRSSGRPDSIAVAKIALRPF